MEQPSHEAVLPSSQSSLASTDPSPQAGNEGQACKMWQGDGQLPDGETLMIRYHFKGVDEDTHISAVLSPRVLAI